MSETALRIVTGLWGVAALAMFVAAVGLSYRIKARSPELQDTGGTRRTLKVLHAAFNWKVARDPETQVLRRRMNTLLLLAFLAVPLLRAGLWLAWGQG